MRKLCEAALAVVLLAGTEARAFVRSATDRGTPIHWAGSCSSLVSDVDLPAELTPAATTAAIHRAVANWQSLTLGAGGSYFKIDVATAAPVEAHNDGKNVIKFRKDKWCRPAEPGQPQLCFSSQVSGMTTVFYVARPGDPQDGQITDADIELNAVNFTFVNQPSSVQPREGTLVADLENTLTHELGHFQGLAHTCWEGASGAPQPSDDQGNPVPDCSMLSSLPADQRAKITSATMYNFAGSGETSKRTPKADDVAGIAAVYPIARDPKRCEAPDSGGCGSVPGAASPSLGGLGLLAALLALTCGRTRKKRRGRARRAADLAFRPLARLRPPRPRPTGPALALLQRRPTGGLP